MSLWDKVECLSSEAQGQLIQLYESNTHRFPIEIRKSFANIIENTLCTRNGLDGSIECSKLDKTDLSSQLKISEFLTQLISALEQKLNQQEEQLPFFIRHKLSEALQDLKTRFGSDPLGLYSSISECIQFEISLVQQHEQSQIPPAEKDIIMENLQIVKRRIAASVEILHRLVREQEAYEITLNDKQCIDDKFNAVQNVQNNPIYREVESRMQENIRNLILLMREYEKRVNENRRDCSELQTGIFTQIAQWKFQQQQLANGLPSPNNSETLNKLRMWCEELAELLWTSRQRLKEAQALQKRNPILIANFDTGNLSENNLAGVVNNLIEDFNTLIIDLINFGFIVENQPPQVMKLGTRFPSPLSVSLLVGTRLNIQMTSPVVTTKIISEAQARTLSVSDKLEESGEIANGSTNLEYNKDAKRLIANFRSIQLKRIKRADKKGGIQNSECVMEEKFCLLFQSEFAVGDLKIRIHALSLPVVVISHGSQEALAVATITWDNAFGEINRIPFQVPNRVSWSDLAQILSLKFHAATGRGLTEDHLRWLKQKAFKNVSHSEYITWNEFCKDNLPDRGFSFWEWFYEALRVISKKETNLKDLWKDGLILGFVDRLHAENSLLTFCEPGTFLLRFADSIPGAITIAWIHSDRNIYHVAPFNLQDLSNHKLADKIKDLANLTFLHPNILKSEAFGKYYSPAKPKPPGINAYVPTKISIQVENDENNSPSATPDRRRSSGSTSLDTYNYENSSTWQGAGWQSPSQQVLIQPGSPYFNPPDMSMDTASNFVMSPSHNQPGSVSPNPLSAESRIPDFATLRPASSTSSNMVQSPGTTSDILSASLFQALNNAPNPNSSEQMDQQVIQMVLDADFPPNWGENNNNNSMQQL